MRPQRQSDQGTNTRALGSVRGGTVAYQKIFNGHFVTSVSSLGRETEHLGPQREAAVYNNAHMSLCNNSNSLALSRGSAMPLAHSKLQQRVGGGRVLDIYGNIMCYSVLRYERYIARII